jgi:hypothetical protein
MANLGPIPSRSPAVNFREVDLTGVIQQTPAATGAIVGNFTWGPVGVPTLVDNEDELVRQFGTPTTSTSIDYHNAAYFLRYSTDLAVIREVDGDSASATTANNAFAITSPSTSDLLIKDKLNFDNVVDTLDNFSGDSASDPALVRGHSIIARYPGTLGNSIEVQICPGDSDGDAVFNAWDYKSSFPSAPGTSSFASARDGSFDELHVVVIDKNGALTGTKGTVLETFPYVSAASNARTLDGDANYVKTVINENSNYIYWASAGSSLAFDSDEWGLATYVGTDAVVGTTKNFTSGLSTKTFTLASGANSGTLGTADFIRGFDEVDDPEKITVDLLIAPGMSSQNDQVTVTNDLVSVARTDRKDAVAVTSTHRSGIVGVTNNATITNNIVNCANLFTNSSYLVTVGNYLKVYDRFNDQYITIPAASSVAGIMAATGRDPGPWYSPAGSRRGQILGISSLAYNPNKSQRDDLYDADVNPIVNLIQQGTLLYGDKTMLGRPSAFDRINVRRLFNTIERDISNFAKDILFEFNDEFTRAQFVGIVEPYLRAIQAARGITDFRVICDETNNPASVVDANQFVATMLIKPARSINFITLNFVAVRTGASFEEISGGI